MAQDVKVLFLGNSYTYSNGGIYNVLDDISTSLGKSIYYDKNTPGGYRLLNHSQDEASLSKIQSENWDYVILQGQSQYPAFADWQVAIDVLPYAKILCDSIYSNDSCSIPLFFMTWGRENGDISNCEVLPEVCTYEGMQNRLRRGYLSMAQQSDAQVSPVGMVWKAIREDFPSYDLYSTDGSHPSVLGTYLASCVFYASIFHESPIGASFSNGIDESVALNIQTYAGNIVLDSLEVWNIDTANVHANFIMDEPIGKAETFVAHFVNVSENFEYCVWDFGDGSTFYQDQNDNGVVEHEYEMEGQYDVCLYAHSKCDVDTICKVYDTDFYQNIDAPDNVTVFFDSQNDQLVCNSNLMGKRLWIYDSLGRLVDSKKVNSSSLDLSRLKGLHIIKINDSSISNFKVFVGEKN